jgi:hypothetical protein
MTRRQVLTFVVTALIIVAMLGAAVLYFWGPCGNQSTADAWTKIRPLLGAWFDAYYLEAIPTVMHHQQIL